MKSKYYKWNKTGMKIIIDTGYKAFDNYISCISKGNCIGRGQLSFYVRPYNETTCNNQEFSKGHLRNYDLNMFSYIPYNVRDFIENITTDKGCVLYEFSTRSCLFGCIVEQDNKYYKFVIGNNSLTKREKCLNYIIKILKEKRGR